MTRPTRVRWFPVLTLIAFGTMLNYLDRTVLGIAAPSLAKDLGLTAGMMGVAFSAFSWSYALLQIPGGIGLIVSNSNPSMQRPSGRIELASKNRSRSLSAGDHS